MNGLPLALLLVGVPLVVIALVAFAVLGPQWSRAGRWRPGQPWLEQPVWFGGLGEDVPPAVEAAAEAAKALVAGEGVPGAAAPSDGLAAWEVTDEGLPVAELVATADYDRSTRLGGARGQW